MTSTRSTPSVLRGLDHLGGEGLYPRWVRRAILVTTAAYATVTAADLTLFGLSERSYPILTQSLVVLAGIVGWVIARRGRVGPAALIVLAAVWLELHSGLPMTGVLDSSLIAFPVVVAAAGMILGGRAGYLVAGVTTLTIPGLVVLGRVVGDATTLLRPDEIYLTCVVSASMFAAAALVQLGLDSIGAVLVAARLSEQRLSNILNHAPDGVVATDSGARVVGLNPAAERILDCGEAEAKGRPLADMMRSVAAGQAETWTAAALRRRAGDEASMLSLYGSGDTWRWVELAVAEVPWDEGSTGFQLILRDVTAQREADEARQAMRAQLENAQRLEAVGRLAGGVAHEFNNILTVVGGSAELLLEGSDSGTHELAEQIKSAQTRGAGLTKKLLSFARRDLIQPRRMSVAQTIRDMEPLLQQFLTGRVHLALELPEDGFIVADRSQMEQILVNLVLNAKDAVRGPGRVTVGVAPGGTSRTWEDGSEWTVEEGVLEIWVEDDGGGMDAETRRRAFEPFFTTKPAGTGSGLGLSTVHGIVVQNGGRVRVMSEPDLGTLVVMTWPVATGA